MPGAYTGEFVVFLAPSDCIHTGKYPVTVHKGHSVYMHPGHTLKIGNLLITYPHNNRDGRPYLEMELVK